VEQASGRSLSPKPFTKGLVQVITGDGKGKTTSALGTVVRALGHGLRVYFVSFLKGDIPSGEWNTLSKLPNIDFEHFGAKGFIGPRNSTPQDREQAEKALAAAHKALVSGNYNLVVMDEVNVALAFGLVSLEEVIRVIRDRPEDVELILTGRKAAPEVIELADLVTECVLIKHPYDSGVTARRGIEY